MTQRTDLALGNESSQSRKLPVHDDGYLVVLAYVTAESVEAGTGETSTNGTDSLGSFMKVLATTHLRAY